jgi:ATP-dependent RNA helicase RhlB
VQIEEEAKMLAKYLPFKIGSFYGGVGYTQQQQLLKDNVQILVGTPGRVLDLNKSGRMNLMDIAFLVLDEADRMFDMGFYPDLRKLIKVVPPADRRQTMLFSATLNAWVKNLAWEYTKSPFEIEIEPEIVTVEEIEQILYHVPSEEKMKLLLGILEREKPESAIIFCNTKRYTEIVSKRLRINGYDCEFIIGDLPQSRRLKVIDDVKAGKIKFLVATDVAARGLDIEGLSMVINYDLPVESENYVHRIGRTARAGKTGKAITLASEQDVYELPAIERYIGKKIPSEIAAPELHAEDKSSGMQIRTEFYEDRREERRLHGSAKVGVPSHSGRGARPQSDSRRRSDRHGVENHRTERYDAGGRDSASSRGDKHRADTRGAEGRRTRTSRPGTPSEAPRRGENRKSSGGLGLTEQDRDISRLSFEERMAYYKQKYDSAPAAASSRKERQDLSFKSGETAETRPHKESARNGRKGRKNRQNAPQTAPDLPRRPEANGKGGGRGSEKAAPAKAKKRGDAPQKQQGAASAQTTPKKGIIARLLGIFKKDM